MAGVRGVGHVGLRPIFREIASRETCTGRETDCKREPLPRQKTNYQVIRISSSQSNVLLPDCKIKGVPVTAVVDCGSPICILSNEFLKYIGVNDTLGKVGSKVVGAKGSQLDILGTMELDTALKGECPTLGGLFKGQ